MKKILGILGLLMIGALQAQTLKFSDFTAETAPAGTDYLVGYRTPGVAGGNRRFSLTTLQTYFTSGSQPLDADLTALAALSGTNNIYYRSAPNTWSPVTFSGATFSGGVLTITGGSGSGDVSSNTTTTVDSEVALFSSTGGKTIKRATGTGVAHLTSGVLSAAQVNLASEATGILPLANVAPLPDHIGLGVDGSGSVLTAGSVIEETIEWPCTVTAWYIVTDQSGSVIMDVLKGTSSGSTTTYVSIAGSGIPSVSSSDNANGNVSLWSSTTFAAGDKVRLRINGTPTSATRAALTLKITRP